jgi:hypothetical protein
LWICLDKTDGNANKFKVELGEGDLEVGEAVGEEKSEEGDKLGEQHISRFSQILLSLFMSSTSFFNVCFEREITSICM